MSSMNVKDIVKRYEVLKGDRMLWEPFFRDVRDYIRPRKQGVDSSTLVSGERHTNKMFDSSAPEASRLMAMSMQNALVPQSVVWFGLSIPSGHPFSALNIPLGVITDLEGVVHAGGIDGLATLIASVALPMAHQEIATGTNTKTFRRPVTTCVIWSSRRPATGGGDGSFS